MSAKKKRGAERKRANGGKEESGDKGIPSPGRSGRGGVRIEIRDGKQVIDRGRESELICSSAEVADSEAERRISESYEWKLMELAHRAFIACELLAKRATENGRDVDVDTLLNIIGMAIRGIERSPRVRDRMENADKWPAFVPGGAENGPLRKGWAKDFARRGVGLNNPGILRHGRADFATGKPAALALLSFNNLMRHRETQRPLADEPAYVAEIRNLPDLSTDCVFAWRDAAMVDWSRLWEGDWISVNGLLSGREQTVKTKMRKKSDNGAETGTGEIDVETARSNVSAALLDGFRALALAKERVK